MGFYVLGVVLDDYKKLKPEEKAQLFKKFRMVGGKLVEVAPREGERTQEKIKNFLDSKEYEKEAAEKEKEILRKKRLAAAKLAEEQSRRERERAERNATMAAYKMSASSVEQSQPKQAYVASAKPKQASREEAVKSFSAFIARLKCVFGGVLRLFDDKFTRSFFRATLFDLTSTLERIQSILVSALHQDPQMTDAIQEKLEKIGRPYYFELVWRLDHIYEPGLFGSIEELRSWKRQVKQGKFAFRDLFKKLYALKKYVPILKQALETLLLTEARIRNLKTDIVRSNIRFMNRNIDAVFDGYYPKLLLLMNFYYQIRLFFNPNETFDNFLNVEKSDIVGYYTQLWREQKEYEERKKKLEEAAKREKEKENKKKTLLDRIKENDALGDAVKEGLQEIFEDVDFARMKTALEESKDAISILSIDDKVFLIFTLIEHFYRQYSFLFLSGQVRYNIFFDKNGTRADLKNTLKDIYFRMNSIYQRIREYIKIVGEIRKFTANFTVEVDDSMPEMKKLLNQQIDLLRIINYETKQRMEQYSKVFYYIMRDYVGKNEVLQNGGDFLDMKLVDKQGRPKPQKRIFQLFREAYNFSMAFYFLLTEADLNTAETKLKEPEYLKIPLPGQEEEAEYEATREISDKERRPEKDKPGEGDAGEDGGDSAE